MHDESESLKREVFRLKIGLGLTLRSLVRLAERSSCLSDEDRKAIDATCIEIEKFINRTEAEAAGIEAAPQTEPSNR